MIRNGKTQASTNEGGERVKFTFIVPVYERKGSTCRSFCRCLDSIAAQTDKNFNVIVVHDGENEMVQKITVACKRVMDVSFYSVPYLGIRGGSHCINFALQLPEVCGEYVAFINGDNIVRPDYVAEMYDTGFEILYCMVLHNDMNWLVTSGMCVAKGAIDRANYAVRSDIAKEIGHQSIRLEQDWDFLAACMRDRHTNYRRIEKILVEHN